MTIAQLFGKTLQKIREEKGLSQERLAQSSGYHRTYISMLERGLRTPTLEAIFNIAIALGVSASSIVLQIEQMPNALDSLNKDITK